MSQQWGLRPCPRCAQQIPGTSVVCPNCGLQLVPNQGPPPPPPPPPAAYYQPAPAPVPPQPPKQRSRLWPALGAGLVTVLVLTAIRFWPGNRPTPSLPPIVFATPSRVPTTPPTAAPTATVAATSSAALTAPPPSPTGAQPPTAAPSGGDAIGKKITLGDEEFVTLKAAEYSSDGYNEFFKPEAGNVVYAFLIEIEGIDPDGATYNRLYFKMFADGFEYSHTLFGKEPGLGSSNTLEPGQLVQGWVSFEAPLVDEVTLVYEPGIGLDGKATWVFDVN